MDKAIEILEESGGLTDVTQIDTKTFQGYKHGKLITVSITKNPRLGYCVELQSNGKKLLGNHDKNLGIAIAIAHWQEL